MPCLLLHRTRRYQSDEVLGNDTTTPKYSKLTAMSIGLSGSEPSNLAKVPSENSR